MFAYILLLFSLCLKWGTYQLTSSDIKHSLNIGFFQNSEPEPSIISIYANEMKVDVTGASGQAIFGLIRIRYWTLHLMLFLGITLAYFGGHVAHLKNISRALGALCLALSMIFVVDIIARGGFLRLGYGSVAFIVACLAVIITKSQKGKRGQAGMALT